MTNLPRRIKEAKAVFSKAMLLEGITKEGDDHGLPITSYLPIGIVDLFLEVLEDDCHSVFSEALGDIHAERTMERWAAHLTEAHDHFPQYLD